MNRAGVGTVVIVADGGGAGGGSDAVVVVAAAAAAGVEDGHWPEAEASIARCCSLYGLTRIHGAG